MRWIRPTALGFRPRSPFRTSDLGNQPTIWDKINDNISCGLINVITVEGPSQAGKTTLGGWISARYDPHPTLIYNVREALEMCEDYAARYERGDMSMLWKWNLFDEPQQEAPNTKWLDERAQVIAQIVNGYGFLKQNLVLALPDLGDIGKRVYSNNLTYRIRIQVKRRAGVIERTAWVYRPWKPIYKDKWTWRDVGFFKIPEIAMPPDFMGRKVDNFKEKLTRWRDSLDRQDIIHKKRLGIKPIDPYAPSWSRK